MPGELCQPYHAQVISARAITVLTYDSIFFYYIAHSLRPQLDAVGRRQVTEDAMVSVIAWPRGHPRG